MREQAHPVERVCHAIVRTATRRSWWTPRVCLRQGVERDRFELGPTGVDQQPADGRHQRDPIIGVNSVPDRPEIRAHSLHFTVDRLAAKQSSR